MTNGDMNMSDTDVDVAQPELGPVPLAGSIRRTVLDWRDCWLVEAEILLHHEVHALLGDMQNVVFKNLRLPVSSPSLIDAQRASGIAASHSCRCSRSR